MLCLAASLHNVTHEFLPAAETTELGCQTAESPKKVHDDSKGPETGTEVAIVGPYVDKVINCPSALQAECILQQESTGALCYGSLCAEGYAQPVSC